MREFVLYIWFQFKYLFISTSLRVISLFHFFLGGLFLKSILPLAWSLPGTPWSLQEQHLKALLDQRESENEYKGKENLFFV